MRIFLNIILLVFLLFATGIFADSSNLLDDMLIVDYWNKRLNDRLPVTFNHLLQGGYFNMPSARMGCEGEIGAGYSSVPPYRNYNLRFQLIDQLEISGNYRVFRGVDDPILTPLGFGDFSDKGANIKLALFSPEDSDYRLPGLAIGLEDFMGTQNFCSQYIVLTKVFPKYNLEASLGWGRQRIRGFFGGLTWFPFHRSSNCYLKDIALVAEYDATPYKDPHIEKHPKGRVKKTPINFGMKYRLGNTFDFSLACVRGNALAFSISSYYNLGHTSGFLPKINDPLPYRAPVNVEPLGERRPEEMLVQDILYAFREQGFDLLDVWISRSFDVCQGKILRLNIVNNQYRLERDVRMRLNNLLAYLIPANIDTVIVVIESEGFPLQEYHYRMEYVRQYGTRLMGPHELRILTPMQEVSSPDRYVERQIFKRKREILNVEIFPKTRSFFGSSKGKFKFALGLNACANGYFGPDIFYSICLGYIFFSDLDKLKGADRLNPSQLINVRTDIMRYYRKRELTLDEAYLQRSWNLGQGFFARLAGGYFEEEYGGIATEFLYYPVKNHWAIGVEGAVVKKRKFSGIAFTDRICKLHGFQPSYQHFLGSQYFVDFYYDWRAAKIDLKAMVGKFLANDIGVRWEMSRYFPSGMRLLFWYTMTNGHDKINGHTYYDKGIAISMPLDIFYTYTDRPRWYYGMSAWLRDVGVMAETGRKLYELISDSRSE